MKKLLILSALLVFALPARGAITRGTINFTDNGVTTVSTVVVVMTGITTGSSIVCGATMNSSTGNTFTKISDDKNGPGTSYLVDSAAHAIATVGQIIVIAHIENAVSGTTTITAQFSQSKAFGGIACVELKGVPTSSVLDVGTVAKDTTGTNATCNSMTTTANGDYIFGWLVTNSVTATAGAGFTVQSTLPGVPAAQEDQIQGSAGSITVTYTNSSDPYGCSAASYKASGGGGGTVIPRHRQSMYGNNWRKESEGYATTQSASGNHVSYSHPTLWSSNSRSVRAIAD